MVGAGYRGWKFRARTDSAEVRGSIIDIFADVGFLDRSIVGSCCRMGEPPDALQRLIGDQVKLSTTPCILAELKALGKEFQGTGCNA